MLKRLTINGYRVDINTGAEPFWLSSLKTILYYLCLLSFSNNTAAAIEQTPYRPNLLAR